MLDQIHLLAAVTVLGVLEQAYFFLQVIYARRAFGISPPKISGPPEFERVFRAQVNSSEYFPIFLALLWQAGLFFHQGLPRCTSALEFSGSSSQRQPWASRVSSSLTTWDWTCSSFSQCDLLLCPSAVSSPSSPAPFLPTGTDWL
ncbi:leukotriene C4 synthase-like isoform X2 [Melanerpes formicivorus]|uniref:leukotriene C4 synthase-like isoform X2 n=1 Tax=Melanerpes formicivorus TaxID=211600 RepID=UPI00358F6E73